MIWLRHILPVLLILGFAFGTTMQAAQVGMMAGMQAVTMDAMEHGGMAGCEGCPSDQETGKGTKMASCNSGSCIVLPGLLPDTPRTPAATPDVFDVAALMVTDSLLPAPDHRPPKRFSLA